MPCPVTAENFEHLFELSKQRDLSPTPQNVCLGREKILSDGLFDHGQEVGVTARGLVIRLYKEAVRAFEITFLEMAEVDDVYGM
jgi:hypothetical protein